MPRTTPGAASSTTGQIEMKVRRALELDAAGDRAADSLYSADARIIADARARLGTPRFAGVGFGGRVTIAAATVTLQGQFAWAMVDYRWFNVTERQAEAGRATFILEQRPEGWRIVHAHSSHLLPWDR
jgi:hypothetical protein